MNRQSRSKKLNLKQGSVTVFITLILVPCVFFTGFLVDLARLKLFSNQAVMAADAYGAAALAEYDARLYSLYGLFAMSQDGELDIKAANEEILKTFNANDGSNDFMPYANAKEMELSIEMLDASKMSHADVLETQIADYMKYRIIKNFVDSDAGGFIDAINGMEHLEENLEAAEALEELKNNCSAYDDASESYYNSFGYVRGTTNSTGSSYPTDVNNLNSSIRNYNSCVTEYNNAQSELSAAQSQSSDDEDEQREIANRISAAQSRVSTAKKNLDNAGEDVTSKKVTLSTNYNSFLTNSSSAGAALLETSIISNTNKAKANEALGKVDAESYGDFRTNAEAAVNNIDVLNESNVNTLDTAGSNCQSSLESALGRINPGTSYVNELSGDYTSGIFNDSTYQKLKSYYESESTETKKAQSKKTHAQTLAKEKIKELNRDDANATDARDIPAMYGSAAGRKEEDLNPLKFLSYLKSLFSGNNLVDIFIDDYYLVEYDFGMFTNRTTNVKEQGEKSLAGYEFKENVNYSYLAEIEYLIAGKSGEGSAEANLKYVRNRILAFRMMMNYMSTYACTAVNAEINSFSAGFVIAPALAFALNQALRIGVASFETYRDWADLMNGESNILFKKDVADFAPDSLSSFGCSGGSSQKNGIELDYKQLCEVMLFFFTDRDQRVQRTANLIEMNVNCVALNLGADGTLSSNDKFSMDKAYTAVDATFKSKFPFAVMPKGFAKQVAPNKYNAIEKVERNYYKYTVTRGY